MPRRIFSTVCLLCGLLSLTAHAQSASDIPTKIEVAGERQISVGQKTVLRVALLNDQGQQVAAVSDTPVTLLATKQRDARSARDDAHGSEPQRGDTFVLADGRSTVHTTVVIPRGQSHVGVGFSSRQAGAIRIYGESDKYATGYAIIAVFAARASSSRGRDLFVNAAYQEAAPAGSRLVIEQPGTPPSIDKKSREWMHEFSVWLHDDKGLAYAQREIKVALVWKGGTVEPSTVVIPKRAFKSETTVKVLSPNNGDVTVTAIPEREPGIAATPPETFDFSKAKIATKLVVETFPSAQPASGRDPITLVVRAVDEAKNTILSKDERLDRRDVMLTLDGESYGLKFEDGAATVSISGDQLYGERKIFGYGPVSGTKVIARARNGLGVDIVGVGEIEFRFPWWQLGFALLGGACLPASRKLAGWRRRHQPSHELLTGIPIEASVGAMLGGIFFGLVFFGAVAITELNWGGVPVILTKLPIQHSAFAAFLIGVLGGVVVIGTRSLLKSAIADRLLRESPSV